jgi:hypothetical protein
MFLLIIHVEFKLFRLVALLLIVFQGDEPNLYAAVVEMRVLDNNLLEDTIT